MIWFVIFCIFCVICWVLYFAIVGCPKTNYLGERIKRFISVIVMVLTTMFFVGFCATITIIPEEKKPFDPFDCYAYEGKGHTSFCPRTIITDSNGLKRDCVFNGKWYCKDFIEEGK